MACGEGYLEVVATRVGIEVKQFAHDIQTWDEARLHCFRIYFFKADTALGDDGGVVVACADEGKLYILEERKQALALGGVDLMETFVILDVQPVEGELHQFGGQPKTQGVVEEACAVGVEVGNKTAVERVGSHGGLEVDMGDEAVAIVEEPTYMTAGRKDDRTVESIGREGHLAKGVEELLAV